MDKTDKLLKSMKSRPEKKTPIAADLFIPNHSGDHSKGRVTAAPTTDYEIANKKYVDDNAGGGDFSDGGEAGGADRTLGNTDNYDFGILTNNTIRLHVQNDGNVGIGTTGPGAQLQVDSGADDRVALITKANSPTTTADLFQAQASDGTVLAKIEADGDIMGSLKESSNKYLYIHPNSGTDGLMDVTGDGTNKNLQYGLGAFNLAGNYPISLYASTEARGTFFTSSQTGNWNPSTGLLWTTGSVGIGTTGPNAKLDINSDKIIIQNSKTPSSASDTGTTGTVCWDADYIYICTATDTWKRTAIASW